ncbi:AMP-binding protein [Nocardioides sp. BGMRC 2183]|nr:AMP-binding protein [Nocardioides sp. BGMRC 2183]
MTPRTVPALLAQAVSRFPDRPALVDGAVRLSYSELAVAVDRVARAFLAAGVRPGDRVALWLPNRHEFVLALLGAQHVGAAMVPLNTRYRGREAHQILQRSGARALVVAEGFLGNDYLAMLESAGDSGRGGIAELDALECVIDLGGGEHPAAVGWEEFLAGAERISRAELATAAGSVTADTVADIVFTSGTTGVPKGVVMAHRQTVGTGRVWAENADLSADDRYGIVNPFFHVFGYKAGIVASLAAGSAIYPIATFDPVGLMTLIQDEHLTVLPGAPTIFLTLISEPRRAEFDLSSLRFSIAGATTVPPTLYQEMMDVLGFERVAQAYGLTECVVATTSRRNEDPLHLAETSGPAVPGIEVRVVDGDGTPQQVGVDGEVQLRGENVMLGYFEDPVATDATIDAEGWLSTGDVGRLDEHGCLRLTDRVKDMFTVGGFNVYPAEVEHVITGHPSVQEAAVIGVPDQRLGSVGRAYLTTRPGAVISDEEMVAYCRERLANFKVPREVRILDAFPRNASGKILKKDLRAV